jgi:hypothetical protein
MAQVLESFEAARFRFQLAVATPLYLPTHAGSAFRGGFGHAFRKVVCRLGCTGECRQPETCAYAYVFETPAPPGSRILAKVGTVPRPFIIEPLGLGGRTYQPGERISFSLVLVGRAIGYLPYFIYAFEELGRVGLGPAKGKYLLESVECAGSDSGAIRVFDAASRRVAETDCRPKPAESRGPAPPPGSSITVEFLSPTQLQFEGHRGATGIQFHVLLRNLMRRVNFLNYFHCGGELLEGAAETIRAASAIETVEARLEWQAWERYSSRQSQRVPMRGFTGPISYRGDFSLFWPWLAAGEWVHVGKAATFGLGQYRLTA